MVPMSLALVDHSQRNLVLGACDVAAVVDIVNYKVLFGAL